MSEKGGDVRYQPGSEGHGGDAHVTQPQSGVPGVVYMPRPLALPGVPAGLEYLTQIDQILVHQQVHLLEAITGWEVRNKYQVKNSVGQQVYFATEESGICMRQCCANGRGFIMHITDNMGQEVMRVTREFKCCAGCCWCASASCCAWVVTIEAPVGTVIGSVRQKGSYWIPKYDVMDGDGQKIFDIKGPCCICQFICCPDDLDFNITVDNREIGKISKQWGGVARECFTRASNFSLAFPIDLDVRMKAVLLGAVFLVDFMFFEFQGNNS